MKKSLFFFLSLSLIVNLVELKEFKNKTHLNKTHANKNSTQRAFLIKTNLTKTDIEKILNQSNIIISNTSNGIIVSEIDDDLYPDELDIEIEDEIMDNYTKPMIVDFTEKESNISEAKSFIVINNEKNSKKGIFWKFIQFLSIIIFIYGLIYLNNLKKSKKDYKSRKFYEFDLRDDDYLISKSE